jgi:uncharacterized membrane protein YobD (UPF0266 family)
MQSFPVTIRFAQNTFLGTLFSTTRSSIIVLLSQWLWLLVYIVYVAQPVEILLRTEGVLFSFFFRDTSYSE